MSNKKHAYFIVAFNQWPLLEKLIRLLDDSRNDIYIHINKNIRDFDFEYFENIPVYSNLYFTERFETEWGTPRLMVSQMYFLQMAQPKHYQYYHFLSGSCLPLKTQSEIHDFFDAHEGEEFVHFVSDPPMERRIYERYSLDHRFLKHIRSTNIFKKLFFGVLCEKSYTALQKFFHFDKQRKNPNTLCFGGTWWSITDDLAIYVLENWDYLLEYFRHTFAPDETYLQTLVYNSSFKERLYYNKMDDNYTACMRYVDWKRGNPYTWTSKDYNELMNSNYLFARKFDLETDSEIIDSIYTEIIKKQAIGGVNN